MTPGTYSHPRSSGPVASAPAPIAPRPDPRFPETSANKTRNLTSPPAPNDRSVPVIRARPDRRRSVVAAATLPGRNPDGSYGHPRPADSTVPHAISEPAALTDEEVDAVIAMEKWAKAEEGMRLVQELESHSAQRDDAIADLQNMLNGIGKAPTDTEAAALAAQPVAPTEFIPPQTPVDHAANNIVPEVPAPVPVPAPVHAHAAVAPAASAMPPPPASVHAPVEGGAGALEALARGELPASFPAAKPKKFKMRNFGDDAADSNVAPAAAMAAPSAPMTPPAPAPAQTDVFYEASAWPKGETSEWPRVKGVVPAEISSDASIDSLAAMKVAEAEAAIHANAQAVPVVPLGAAEGSDPFAAFLSHVDNVLERSEKSPSYDEDDEVEVEIEIEAAPEPEPEIEAALEAVDPIEEEARAFAQAVAEVTLEETETIAAPEPEPVAEIAAEAAAPVAPEPEAFVETEADAEEDVHAELKLARDRLEAAEAFAETLAHDMEHTYAEMASAKSEAAAAKRLAESSRMQTAEPPAVVDASARAQRVSELLDELEKWQLAAGTADAALEEAKMELEVMNARAAENDDDLNDDVIAELASELEAAEAKAAKAEADADELDRHLEAMNKELTEARAATEAAEALPEELEVAKAAQAELEEALAAAEEGKIAALVSSQALLDRASAAASAAASQLKELKSAKATDSEEKDAELAALKAGLEEARAALAEAESEKLGEVTKELEDAREAATAAATDALKLRDVTAELDAAKAEIDAERAAKSALEKGLEQALVTAEEEKTAALESVTSELEETHSRLEELKNSKAADSEEKAAELTALKAGLEEARAFVAEKAAEIEELKKAAAENLVVVDGSALVAAKEAEKAAETIQAAAEQLREAKTAAADLGAQMEAKDMEIAALRLECDDVKAQASNAAVDGRAKIDALEVKAAAYEEKVAALTMCQETVEDVKMHAAAAALCAAVAMLPRMREAGIIHA